MSRKSSLAAFALAAMLFGCASFEDHVLYQPTRRAPQDYKPPPAPLEDLTLRLPDGTKIHARWCPHPRGRGAVLYCHGNAGDLTSRGGAVRELWEQLGESVLIFDYPGYGFSQGRPSEAGCYAAGDAAYHWLTESRAVRPEAIIVYGESLGGGVAVDLASRRPHRALVLVRTFTSVPDAARAQLAPPVGSLVSNRFDSLAKIGRCKRPVFIAAADKDHVVPFAHGERLHAACADRAEFLRLRGLDHNDPLPAEFYDRLRHFLQERAPLAP